MKKRLKFYISSIFLKSQFWYEVAMIKLGKVGGKFLNYGYTSNDKNDYLILLSEDELNKPFIGLVDQAINGVNIKNKRILILGSGRGGDAEYITKYKQPSEVVAIDRSRRAIHYCNIEYNYPNLRFIHSKIKDIDVNSLGQFDVVVSIESSHCFNEDIFLSKTKDLLVVGGILVLTDFRSLEKMEKLKQKIAEKKMVIEKEYDITTNILSTIDKESESRLEIIHKTMPKFLWKMSREFIGIKGSRIYNSFKKKKKIYFTLHARKV